MPPAQVLTAIQCKSYVDLQAHLEAGGSFVDSDGHLLESTVLADDAIAMKLLLRGNCGLLGGDGRAVVCAARHGRGRVIHVFRSHEDWAKLPATAVDSAFSAAVLGRHAECLDVLLSTDRVSPELLIGGFRQLLSAGSTAMR